MWCWRWQVGAAGAQLGLLEEGLLQIDQEESVPARPRHGDGVPPLTFSVSPMT